MGQVEDEHLDTTELIESMKGIIKLVPDQYYADILYDSLAKTGIKKSHSGDIISVPHTRGFVFRIFNGRKFTELADPNILTLKRHVEKLVGSISLFKEIRLDAYDSLTLDKELPMKKDITSIPLQDKIQKIHQIYEIIEGLDDSLVNVILSYQDSLSKRIFLNTEGSVLRQVIPRTRILIQPIVQ